MITVNPKSEITAQEWVDKIQRTDAPDFIRNHIRAVNQAIAGPRKFVQPPKTIPLDWLADFSKVFNSDLWEITTAHVEFEITKSAGKHTVRKNIFMDLNQGERGPIMCVKSSPGSNDKECSVNRYSLFQSFVLGDGSAELDFGQTFSSQKVGDGMHVELKSGRALVIIINRVQSFGSTGSEPSQRVGLREIPIPDSQLVATLFHELAAHAAAMQAGKLSGHGQGHVDSNAKEAEALVTAKSPIPDVMKALNDTARDLDAAVTGAKRARQPGPIRP